MKHSFGYAKYLHVPWQFMDWLPLQALARKNYMGVEKTWGKSTREHTVIGLNQTWIKDNGSLGTWKGVVVS